MGMCNPQGNACGCPQRTNGQPAGADARLLFKVQTCKEYLLQRSREWSSLCRSLDCQSFFALGITQCVPRKRSFGNRAILDCHRSVGDDVCDGRHSIRDCGRCSGLGLWGPTFCTHKPDKALVSSRQSLYHSYTTECSEQWLRRRIKADVKDRKKKNGY